MLRDRVIQAKRKSPIKANQDSNVLHHHKCFFIRERPRSPSTCIGMGTSTKSLGSSLVPPRPSAADSEFTSAPCTVTSTIGAFWEHCLTVKTSSSPWMFQQAQIFIKTCPRRTQ
jgi:hypothetical protein